MDKDKRLGLVIRDGFKEHFNRQAKDFDKNFERMTKFIWVGQIFSAIAGLAAVFCLVMLAIWLGKSAGVF